MANEHFGHLKLDRRLLRRRNWISPREIDDALSKLPDVSDKAAPPEQDGEKAAGPPPDRTA